MKLVFIHHSLNYDTMIQIEGISHRHHELKYLPNISKEVLREKRLHILQLLYNRIILSKFNCVVTDFSAGSKAIKEYKKLADYLDCGLLIFIGDDLVDTHNLVITSEEDPIVVYMEHIRAQMLILSSGEGTKSSTPGEQPWDIARKFNGGKIITKDSYVTLDAKEGEFGTKGFKKDVNGKYIKDPDYL